MYSENYSYVVVITRFSCHVLIITHLQIYTLTACYSWYTIACFISDLPSIWTQSLLNPTCGTWQFYFTLCDPCGFNTYTIGAKFHVAIIVHVICSCVCMTCAHRPPNHHEMSFLNTGQCIVWSSRSDKIEKIKTKIPSKVHILATARGRALPTWPASSFYEVDSLLLLLAHGLSRERRVMCLCAVAKWYAFTKALCGNFREGFQSRWTLK